MIILSLDILTEGALHGREVKGTILEKEGIWRCFESGQDLSIDGFDLLDLHWMENMRVYCINLKVSTFNNNAKTIEKFSIGHTWLFWRDVRSSHYWGLLPVGFH